MQNKQLPLYITFSLSQNYSPVCLLSNRTWKTRLTRWLQSRLCERWTRPSLSHSSRISQTFYALFTELPNQRIRASLLSHHRNLSISRISCSSSKLEVVEISIRSKTWPHWPIKQRSRPHFSDQRQGKGSQGLPSQSILAVPHSVSAGH